MGKTEITVQIYDDINNVKKHLKDLGYKETEEFTGNDHYFSTLNKNQIGSASYKDLLSSSIIVRSFKTKGNPGLNNSMVFKNKTLDENNNVISEEKISTKIDNLENTLKILKYSNLNNWLNLSQQNAFYKLGEIVITVGTVKGLSGSFMEIEEYESIKNLSSEEKISKLLKLAKSLGFKISEDYSIKKAYMLFKQQNNENENV